MNLLEATRKKVVTISPSATLREAAHKMKQHAVGCLVLTNSASRGPIGIVTDRDIVCRLADGADPTTEILANFARGHVEVVTLEDDVDAITRKMRQMGVRRLPVVNASGQLVGLVSMDDILGILGKELGAVSAAIDRELEFERAMAGGKPDYDGDAREDILWTSPDH